MAKFKIRKDFLPIARPIIGRSEIKEVLETLKTGWITTGPKAFKFEDIFKKYIGSKHAIALNSCTSALHLALAAIGVGKGDEVILSPMTFVSQANVIIHLGATPVFVDVRKETINIDTEKVKEKITDKTKAIIITHFAGQPCERGKFIAMVKNRPITIIEDAAHALGAKWEGEKIGSDPETITCFSFYPIKNITTAEGGMLTTGMDGVAEKVRTLSLHGLSTNAWSRYSGKGSWEYDVAFAGYKYNLPDILAALGIAQMKSIDRFNKKREKLASLYIKGLQKLDGITVPSKIGGIKHAWQIFPVLIDSEKANISRNDLIEELKKLNIGTSVHFKPIHLFKFYREKYGLKEGDLPVSEEIFKRTISLPLYPGMTNSDVTYVLDALRLILGKKK